MWSSFGGSTPDPVYTGFVRHGLKLQLILLAGIVLLTAPATGQPELLPAEIGGWTARGDRQVFAGEDLFLYINGGAEIYHEYGFEQVTVRDYRQGEDRLGVEVYRMAGSAYGIYSFMRPGSGEAVDLADGGSLSDYYALFHAGRDMVVVTAHSEFEGMRRAVLDVSRSLAGRFPTGGEIPALLADLPEQGRVAGSEKYLAGPISLRNDNPAVARMFKGFEEAAVSNYPGGALYLLSWSDEAGARKAMTEAADAGTTLASRRNGRRIWVALPAGEDDRPEDLFRWVGGGE